MNNEFEIGDLVKLDYSEHIGIVIEKSDWIGADARPGPFEEPDYSYRVKWAVGEPYTWERRHSLVLVVGVNNEQSV